MGSVVGGGSSNQTIGYMYFMSLQFGIGRGPVDQIVEIRAGDKMLFPVVDGTASGVGPYPAEGMPTIVNNGVFTLTQINAPELFGGKKGEGGIQGQLYSFWGGPDQIFDPSFKALMDGDVPDFRGVTTLWFDGEICAMNPYPKAWKFRVRRTLQGWDGPVWRPDLAQISLLGGAVIAMNPAHMLYECATNRDWGRGFPRTRLDEVSWAKAAETLHAEGFGLCMRYNRQDDLDQFVQTVIEHIGAAVYTSRETGLLTLMLIRDDYNYNDLPLFTYDTGLISVDEPEVASREDAINEVVVTYKDITRNEERQVRVHNLASTQSLGAKNSQTTDYSGLPTPGLATRVARRDLKVLAASGRRYTVRLDRSGWRLAPGFVFRVSAPDKGLNDIVLRAGKVTDKGLKEGEIEISAVPDIFGLPRSSSVQVQDPAWSQPDRTLRPVLNPNAREATYRDLAKYLSRSDLSQIGPDEAYVIGFASKPSPLSLSASFATKTNSEGEFVIRDTDAFSPTFTLLSAITATITTVPARGVSDLSSYSLPCAAQIDDEIVRVDAVDLSNETMTIARGCVDTKPAPHPSGSSIVLYENFLGFDTREYARGEVVQAVLLTNTSSGTLSIDDAGSPISVSITGRQGRPYSAGNVRINGVSIFSAVPQAADVVISWSHRNRLLLQDQLIGFFEPTNDREDGVSYRVTIFNGNGQIRVVSDITDTSFTYTAAMASSDGIVSGQNYNVSVDTFRGSLQSLYSSQGSFKAL